MAIDNVMLLDLALIQSAHAFDLSDKEDRLRSVRLLEKLFFRVSRDLNPDLFIEAGAKDARSSRRARKYLPKSRIVAFEANPYTYERFRDHPNNSTDRIEYLHQALSDKRGNISFNVRFKDGQPLADGQGSIMSSFDQTVEHKSVTVKTVRLDNYFEPSSFSKCVIWADVEGASREVLAGASGIMPKVGALYIEVEDREKWAGQWLAGNIMSHLMGLGLVPVARDFQSNYQYNLLFLQESALRQDKIRLLLAEHYSATTRPTEA